MEIEGISCSVRHLCSQSLLLYLLSFTFILDPQPIQILSRFFSHHLQTLTPTPPLFSLSITPSFHHVCLSPQLSCCGSALYFLDFTCSRHLSSPFHPFFCSFLSQSICTPREKQGSDEHGEAGTNQSIDLSMYPVLCPSDRQQKTKCLLSETFPISFPPYPFPLHCPPSLVNGELVSGTGLWDLSTQLRLVFQLPFFLSKVTPVKVPNFCISSLFSLTCPPILPI